MRAWPSPQVPSLADHGFGGGGPARVHDTASNELVEVDPPVRARMYVCGITPYDATHMGHAATYLAFDILQRVWRDRGQAVAYVQNVTDVDEPLLERAAATGVDWVELAERETALFREDMAALAVIAPGQYMGAVETVDLAVGLVQRLRAAGAAYEVDGDLYFSVHADPTFGGVSHLDAEAMRRLSAENGGDPDRPGKRDPLDCLLWRAERPGEPAWDSPLGRGRPGWHVECSAMVLHFLGETIDVQGGGSDLVFPHHEMSASQAQVATAGARFATAYVHAGMVAYEGAKMSKSKGNLVLVSDLRRAGHDPMAIRLSLLAHHYRSDWEWVDGPDGDLDRAEQRLAHWRDALSREVGAQGDPVVEEVRAALTDDLDAPRALAAVDAWADTTLAATAANAGTGARTAEGAVDPGAPEAVALVAHALLGINHPPIRR